MPLLTAIVLSLLCINIHAADLPGAKDHPLLKRFGGSEIVGYEVKRFETYELQTSTFKRYDLAAKRREFVKPSLKVEGALTRLWYEAAGDASATELIRNYQNELKAQRFQILYDSTQDPAATMWAEAVVASLTKEYGIAVSRLTAHGVAYLAPVATNTTEEGRAKNRRVELVPW